jgi:thiamine pyrophosphate-dependent acetolactate synthase large subunit-like protein
MTNEVKDTAATVSTIVGGGAFVMGINELLTLALLVTGIILNIIRIRDIRKDKKKED